MSVEMRTKNGKLIGVISDTLDDEDYVVVNNKKRRLRDIYQDKTLRDELNDNIKSMNLDDIEE